MLLDLFPWGLAKQISSLTLASFDVLKREPVPGSGSANTCVNEDQCAERAQPSMKVWCLGYGPALPTPAASCPAEGQNNLPLP